MSIETIPQECECGHDKASHARDIVVNGTIMRGSCLCYGCSSKRNGGKECPGFVLTEERQPRPLY